MLQPGEEYFAHEGSVFQTFIANIVDALKDVNVSRVFADASHLNPASRNKTLNAIRSYLDISLLDVNVIWLKTTLKTCIERNSNREGRANVPETTITDMWKSQREPTFREGVNKVYIVDELNHSLDIKILNNKDENNFIL